MNNKRTLIIAAVAVLGILVSVTTLLTLPRLAESAPVKAQDQASASTGANNQSVSGAEYINTPLFYSDRPDIVSMMKSPGEYINAPLFYPDRPDVVSMMKSPGDKYIHLPLGKTAETDSAGK
jgi:hypothetical protein